MAPKLFKPMACRSGMASMAALLCLTASAPAQASEGCTVLLCLAGNWRAIGQCVPPVRKALRSLALGGSLPTCDFAQAPAFAVLGSETVTGTGRAGTVTRWADASFCPAQYRVQVEQESSTAVQCTFAGAIDVHIDGQLWSRVWWSFDGDSVPEWTPAARAAMPAGTIDDRFDHDYHAWMASQPAAPNVPPGASEGGS